MKKIIYITTAALLLTSTTSAHAWLLPFLFRSVATGAARATVTTSVRTGVIASIRSAGTRSGARIGTRLTTGSRGTQLSVSAEKELGKKALHSPQSSKKNISLQAGLGFDLFKSSSTEQMSNLDVNHLDEAQKAIYKGNLVEPGNPQSAVQHLVIILENDPSNRKALLMMERIVATYQDWAEKKILRDQLTDAQKFLSISQAILEKYELKRRITSQNNLIDILGKERR